VGSTDDGFYRTGELVRRHPTGNPVVESRTRPSGDLERLSVTAVSEISKTSLREDVRRRLATA
jgi:hypothetical protein